MLIHTLLVYISGEFTSTCLFVSFCIPFNQEQQIDLTGWSTYAHRAAMSDLEGLLEDEVGLEWVRCS